MSIQFPAVQDTIVAILVIVAIAVALSVALGVAASFYQRSKTRPAGRATTTPAPIEHPTQVDAPIHTPAGSDRERELVLR
jgi:flagellar basal body-associated protein FliL